jgi:hypothetical protein
MSLDQILQALATQGMADGRVVINVNAPVTINVGEQPVEDGGSLTEEAEVTVILVPMNTAPKGGNPWKAAEEVAKQRQAAQAAEEDKEHPDNPSARPWTPEAVEKLEKVIASIPGNVTEEKLVDFARSNGFTAAHARSLFAMWSRERFVKFLADRGVELRTGRGGGYLKSGLRKAALLKDLQPGCVRNYGRRMHELHMAVAAA